MSALQPLAGIKVLDLSTLLPGPLASLLLAEAGAEVIKLERPGIGDEMRTYVPTFGEASANYAVLNRGKRAYAVDFKDPAQLERVLALATEADIVLEQFRPGVADRLGLGYPALSRLRPDVIYCSITGYAAGGPKADKAGHDVNYLADAGLLNLVADGTGAPSLPVTVLADIAGGTYPAIVNILLALLQRDRTGEGCHLRVSMVHNLQMVGYSPFATHQGDGSWPRPGGELLTGGSPRYQVYATADGRHVVVGALEDKFWDRLVEVLGLDPALRADVGQEPVVIAALSDIFAARPAAHWHQLFTREDVCSQVVPTYEECVAAGFLATDGEERLTSPDGSRDAGALITSIDPAFRRPPAAVAYPPLVPLTNATWSSAVPASAAGS